MNNEILPCPFCGKQPSHEFIPENEFGDWPTHNISCRQSNHHDVQVIALTEDAAIKRWNTRADKAAPVGDVDLDNAREVFEKWITANGDYPHLKHKSFGGNYLHEEVAMKWDGFRAGYYTQPKQSAPVERIEEKIKNLLREFSTQKLSSEMDGDDLYSADFQGAYDIFIKKSRAYLKLQGGNNQIDNKTGNE